MPTTTFLRKPPNYAARAAIKADTEAAALDAAFFKQNPTRQYRARLATSEELAKLTACNAMPPIPDGMQVWTCICQVAPGMRVRRYRAAAVLPWLTHCVPEETACYMFNGD